MGKTALIVTVGAVSALSVGAGTFLAFRANQTPAPAIQDFESARPVMRPPEPAPPAEPDRTTPTRVVTEHPQPVTTARLAAPRESGAVEPAARPPATPPASDPLATPAVTAPPPVQNVEPPPVTAAAGNAAATAAIEPPPVPERPKPRFEEVTVKADSVVGIRIDQSISSETARVEDRITAKVTRDVTVEGRTAIAAGTKLEGVVTMVERGGKFKERARLAIRFNTFILADGLRVPIQTEAILREGDSPSSEAGSKIGGAAVAGAIIGGLIGGKRGAVIGSTAGAAGGTAVVASGGRNEATIQSGAPLTVRLPAPVAITIEREYEIR